VPITEPINKENLTSSHHYTYKSSQFTDTWWNWSWKQPAQSRCYWFCQSTNGAAGEQEDEQCYEWLQTELYNEMNVWTRQATTFNCNRHSAHMYKLPCRCFQLTSMIVINLHLLMFIVYCFEIMLRTMSLKFYLFSFLSRTKSKPIEMVTSSHGPRHSTLLNKLT